MHRSMYRRNQTGAGRQSGDPWFAPQNGVSYVLVSVLSNKMKSITICDTGCCDFIDVEFKK